jgi:hypothetical protein
MINIEIEERELTIHAFNHLMKNLNSIVELYYRLEDRYSEIELYIDGTDLYIKGVNLVQNLVSEVATFCKMQDLKFKVYAESKDKKFPAKVVLAVYFDHIK